MLEMMQEHEAVRDAIGHFCFCVDRPCARSCGLCHQSSLALADALFEHIQLTTFKSPRKAHLRWALFDWREFLKTLGTPAMRAEAADRHWAAAPQEPPPDLRAWVCFIDPQSGVPYYVEKTTGRSTWSVPLTGP